MTGESRRKVSGYMAEKMMTYEQQEAERQERLSEVGTEPPCPWCNRPRVRRSDYTRCNPCGTNWLDGEDLTKDPRLSRTPIIGRVLTATSGGAPTASSTTDGQEQKGKR